MFGLNRIWSALADLASNLTALSSTVAEINVGLRQQTRLNGTAPTEASSASPAPPLLLPGIDQAGEQTTTTPPGRNGRSRLKTASE